MLYLNNDATVKITLKYNYYALNSTFIVIKELPSSIESDKNYSKALSYISNLNGNNDDLIFHISQETADKNLKIQINKSHYANKKKKKKINKFL